MLIIITIISISSSISISFVTLLNCLYLNPQVSLLEGTGRGEQAAVRS